MNYRDLSFASFVEDESNAAALSLCRKLAEGGGKDFQPLWICGPSGCGKTHLLHAVARGLLENGCRGIRFLTATAASEALVVSLEGNSRLWEDLKSCRVLILDEMDALLGKDATQKEFEKLILTLYGQGGTVVMASERAPMDFPLLAWLQSRTETAFCIDIAPPGRELRRKVALDCSAELPFPVTERALAYLIEGTNSVPQIKGALNAADFYHRTTSKKITLPWVKKYLKIL